MARTLLSAQAPYGARACPERSRRNVRANIYTDFYPGNHQPLGQDRNDPGFLVSAGWIPVVGAKSAGLLSRSLHAKDAGRSARATVGHRAEAARAAASRICHLTNFVRATSQLNSRDRNGPGFFHHGFRTSLPWGCGLARAGTPEPTLTRQTLRCGEAAPAEGSGRSLPPVAPSAARDRSSARLGGSASGNCPGACWGY